MESRELAYLLGLAECICGRQMADALLVHMQSTGISNVQRPGWSSHDCNRAFLHVISRWRRDSDEGVDCRRRGETAVPPGQLNGVDQTSEGQVRIILA